MLTIRTKTTLLIAFLLAAGFASTAQAFQPPRPLPEVNRPIRLGVATYVNASGGLYVAEVLPGSPAAKVGLDKGDVLLRSEMRPLRDQDDLRRVLDFAESTGRLHMLIRSGSDGFYYQITAELNRPILQMHGPLGSVPTTASSAPTAKDLVGKVTRQRVPAPQ